jgi:hypothetical protein
MLNMLSHVYPCGKEKGIALHAIGTLSHGPQALYLRGAKIKASIHTLFAFSPHLVFLDLRA